MVNCYVKAEKGISVLSYFVGDVAERNLLHPYLFLPMFDPLNSASAFGGSVETPPWPTTPHPNSPIPNLRRASTPVPPTPDKGPTPGLYGKEPQIYGQPEAGLISPRDTVGSNGTKYEKTEPYLRVRITGLDRNRRDILIRLDAQVTPFHCTALFTLNTLALRRTCRISPARPIATCRARTSNSNNSTTLSCTATLRPSSLLSH